MALDNHDYPPQAGKQGKTGVPDQLRGKRITPAAPAPPEALRAAFSYRSWHSADAPAYQQMLDDPDLWRFMHEDYPDPLTPELAEELIALSQEAAHHLVRAVQWQGQLVGQVRLQWASGPTPPASGEISYWLGRAYWGQGLAAPMVGLFADQCFRAYPALRRIEARIHHDNTPSLRLVERLGFRPQGAVADQPGWQRHVLTRGQGPDWTAISLPRKS
ncbi:MAG: GNAT family N-acetyltransferase [Rhodobacteraceae bacterium]|nr:GNAT family N-acetyltransferase [Paracoccaceae bacterium]